MKSDRSPDAGGKWRRGIRFWGRQTRHIGAAGHESQPEPCQTAEGAGATDEATASIGGEEPSPQSPKPSDADELAGALKTLAAVATALWRVRDKLQAQPQAELPPELRHLPRHIDSAWDALSAGHIEVNDPRGKPYVPGMAVNLLTFQPVDGVTSETVHETIKPSVYYRDTLIQQADVIIACPARRTNPETGNEMLGSAQRTSDNDSPAAKGPEAHGKSDH